MSQDQLDALFGIQDALKVAEDDWVERKHEVIETQRTILDKTQEAEHCNETGWLDRAQEIMDYVKQLKEGIVAQKVEAYEAEKLVLERRHEERQALRELLSSMLPPSDD
ncbi:hypothetical protein BJV82DRAFT_659106 [Fennellomyces sp. T-0311]|nr:hypothetical protein BJV82DRAFT_659106 [Fennellomyces sp. T-0311]